MSSRLKAKKKRNAKQNKIMKIIRDQFFDPEDELNYALHTGFTFAQCPEMWSKFFLREIPTDEWELEERVIRFLVVSVVVKQYLDGDMKTLKLLKEEKYGDVTAWLVQEGEMADVEDMFAYFEAIKDNEKVGLLLYRRLMGELPDEKIMLGFEGFRRFSKYIVELLVTTNRIANVEALGNVINEVVEIHEK